jgi:hypothetical protein
LLAKILGVSPPKVTRLYNGDYKLDERRKEWEFALLFVCVPIAGFQTAVRWI